MKNTGMGACPLHLKILVEPLFPRNIVLALLVKCMINQPNETKPNQIEEVVEVVVHECGLASISVKLSGAPSSVSPGTVAQLKPAKHILKFAAQAKCCPMPASFHLGKFTIFPLIFFPYPLSFMNLICTSFFTAYTYVINILNLNITCFLIVQLLINRTLALHSDS